MEVKGKCSEIVADQIRPVRPIGEETGHAYPGDAAACVGSCAKCIRYGKARWEGLDKWQEGYGHETTAAYK